LNALGAVLSHVEKNVRRNQKASELHVKAVPTVKPRSGYQAVVLLAVVWRTVSLKFRLT
jgi:hypothetical protein